MRATSSLYVSFGFSDPHRLSGLRGGGVTDTGGVEAASGAHTLVGDDWTDERGDGGGSAD